MKHFFFFFMLLPLGLMAQLAGNWVGELAYGQAAFPAQLRLKVTGQKVAGQLTLSMGGVTQVSTIDAKILEYSANKSANGKITDSENNTTAILLGIDGQQLNISIAIEAQYGGGNMIGGLARSGNSLQNPAPSQQANTGQKTPKNNDRLPRDPVLIGTWSKFSTYTRNSMNTEEYWTFNADGTMSGQSRSSAIIYDRVEANYDGGWVENQGFKAEREAGIRWFTRNNQFFYKMPDGSEKLQFYYTIEHYNGKINLFARANPNQQKAGASFTKVN